MRRAPERGETAAAGAFAAVVGLVAGISVFYVARMLLSRDEVRLSPPAPGGGEEGG